MIYVTTRQRPKEKQISWLDLISEDEIQINDFTCSGSAGTVTRIYKESPEELLRIINVENINSRLV